LSLFAANPADATGGTIKDPSRNNGTARDGNRKSKSVERMRRHGAPPSVKDEAVTAGGRR